MCSWIWFATILLSIFASVFMSEIGLYNLLKMKLSMGLSWKIKISGRRLYSQRTIQAQLHPVNLIALTLFLDAENGHNQPFFVFFLPVALFDLHCFVTLFKEYHLILMYERNIMIRFIASDFAFYRELRWTDLCSSCEGHDRKGNYWRMKSHHISPTGWAWLGFWALIFTWISSFQASFIYIPFWSPSLFDVLLFFFLFVLC